jgi:hypothetical protein
MTLIHTDPDLEEYIRQVATARTTAVIKTGLGMVLFLRPEASEVGYKLFNPLLPSRKYAPNLVEREERACELREDEWPMRILDGPPLDADGNEGTA